MAQAQEKTSLFTTPETYKLYDRITQKYYLLDENDNLLSSESFDDIDYFGNDKLLLVGNDDKLGRRRYLEGIISITGEIILPIEYKVLLRICCGNDFLVTKDSVEWIFLDVKTQNIHFKTNAKVVEELNFLYSRYLFLYIDENNKYNILNFYGHKILNDDYDKISVCYSYYQYFEVTKENKYGVVNKEGKIIIPVEYDKIEFVGTPDVAKLFLSKNNKTYKFNFLKINAEYFQNDRILDPARTLKKNK